MTVIVTALVVTHLRQPWWSQHQSGQSSCGHVGEIRVHNRVTTLGTCAADVGRPLDTESVHLGDRIDIHIFGDADERPIIPLPTANDATVLRRDRGDDSTATYDTVGPGRVT